MLIIKIAHMFSGNLKFTMQIYSQLTSNVAYPGVWIDLLIEYSA